MMGILSVTARPMHYKNKNELLSPSYAPNLLAGPNGNQADFGTVKCSILLSRRKISTSRMSVMQL